MGLPDLSDLPSMFERTVSGRTLILDADFPAYQAAATVKKLSTAITRFQTLVETERFLTGAEFVQVHLTPRGCTKCRRYDYPTAKPYQGQRTGPKPTLLTPLRDAILTADWDPHWSVFGWRDREADDGMIMHGIVLGDKAIISSGDKDLCLTPGPYWINSEGRLDVIKHRFGWIEATKTEGGTNKIVGHGTKFFWAQMLMGDSADNVQGIKRWYGSLCGPVKAFEILSGITTEDDAANLVLRAYAKAQQDPLAEAQCLWLRRSLDDCAYRYLCELNIDADLRAWLDALHQYHQEVLAIKAQQKDEESGNDQPETSPSTEARGDDQPVDLPWD